MGRPQELITYEEQPPRYRSAKNTPISEYGKKLIEKDRLRKKDAARKQLELAQTRPVEEEDEEMAGEEEATAQ